MNHRKICTEEKRALVQAAVTRLELTQSFDNLYDLADAASVASGLPRSTVRQLLYAKQVVCQTKPKRFAPRFK